MGHCARPALSEYNVHLINGPIQGDFPIPPIVGPTTHCGYRLRPANPVQNCVQQLRTGAPSQMTNATCLG